ncbi:MAG: hypothetical protein KIS80_03325 [Anaerolineales bacterium]|nr:hypothetical protein [Anaerolineales bacterium]
MREADEQVLAWLLEGDPAVRWQTQRDLLDENPAVYETERAKVTEEGWGARLLSLQDPQGTWAGGLYTPKWTSTHYTLLTLAFLGLPAANAQAQKACHILLEDGFLADHGIRYNLKKPDKHGHAETCITGMALGIFSAFELDDARVDQIARHLLGQQLTDGGWNCRSYRGDTHSSFHTTLLVLEGLRRYLQAKPAAPQAISTAMVAGQQFLLEHSLFRSHRSGTIVKPAFLRTPAQPSWQYDILRALDHFQAAGASRDERLAEAVGLLQKSRKDDGRWNEQTPASGKLWFRMETPGKPGRWNTLRALRVLKWWQASR